MFLGHQGLALAAKRIAPKTSFGTLFLAAEFADCLWPVFLVLGWEQLRIVPGITRVAFRLHVSVVAQPAAGRGLGRGFRSNLLCRAPLSNWKLDRRSGRGPPIGA